MSNEQEASAPHWPFAPPAPNPQVAFALVAETPPVYDFGPNETAVLHKSAALGIAAMIVAFVLGFASAVANFLLGFTAGFLGEV